MSQQEIRDQIKKKVLGLPDIAKNAGISYPYLTKFMKGYELGPRALKKLENYVNSEFN